MGQCAYSASCKPVTVSVTTRSDEKGRSCDPAAKAALGSVLFLPHVGEAQTCCWFEDLHHESGYFPLTEGKLCF